MPGLAGYDSAAELAMRKVSEDGMDTLTPSERSTRMRAIKGKDTKPELAVRRILHRDGYRFRLHRRDLPGRPDIVFPGRRKILLVHGCFWHGHDGCRTAHIPKTRTDYWAEKISSNRQRDARTLGLLLALGWDVEVIWECQVKDGQSLLRRLVSFLGPAGGKRPGAPGESRAY